MRKLIYCLLITLLIPASAFAQTTVPKSPAEIAKAQAQAVVVIEQLDESDNEIGQGSGFIVTPGGAIVTNLHVIQGADALRVKLPNGDVYKTVDVVDFDELKDIAIIKIKGFKLPVVALGDSDYVQQGESVVAIGNPEGLTNSLSTGVISGMRRLETHRVFQITAPISKGSSGGALFDDQGMVIGITTSVLQAGQNINFAVPINYVRGMISDQVTTAVAKLPQLHSSTEVAGNKAPAAASPRGAETVVPQGRLSNAVSGGLGRSPQEPMFLRPDEALAFFNRLVDGLGQSGAREIAELTRTAALIKDHETLTETEYRIPYLSFYSGLRFSLRKSDRILDSVELLVDWSVEDLKRTFGEKFKKKTVDGKQALEMREKREDKQMLLILAMLDQSGNVRSVRFTKTK
ncbi:MAG TPA: S1C family serine protease [Blastocatellia bacterium]|nr:S1C family serine protease [Blastocatellia bacterium]